MPLTKIKAGGIAALAVDTAQLAADAVTNAKIEDGAVDTEHLASDAVENEKIGDGEVDTEHLAADAIEAAELASDAVVNLSVASGAAIATSKISGALTSVNSHGLATSATTDTTNADNIGSGTLAAARVATLNQNTTGSAATVTTNANLTGEVTSSGNAATVADNIIDEANLKVSNSPTNDYMLTAQSGDTGGLTWAAQPSSANTETPNLASCTAFYDVQNRVQFDTGEYIPDYSFRGSGSAGPKFRIYGSWDVVGGHGVFDGDEDHLDPHNPDNVTTGESSTLMAFFNTDTTSGNQAIAGNLRSPDYWNQYGQGILMNGSTLYAMSEENNSNDLISGGTISTGTWYFACARFDTVVNGGGINVGAGGGLTETTGDLSGGGYSYNFRIGGSRSASSQGSTHESGNWFDGMIDVVLAWSRILTDAEVLNLYRFYGQRFYSGAGWDAV